MEISQDPFTYWVLGKLETFSLSSVSNFLNLKYHRRIKLPIITTYIINVKIVLLCVKVVLVVETHMKGVFRVQKHYNTNIVLCILFLCAPRMHSFITASAKCLRLVKNHFIQLPSKFPVISSKFPLFTSIMIK